MVFFLLYSSREHEREENNMSECIMVVDDSEDVRLMTSLILRQAGYRVVEAIDGKDALSKIDEQPVDVVITDLNMPNMGGIELVKVLRSRSANTSIPIIMVTTVSRESKQDEARAAGVTAWVLKPYRPHQLLAAVEKVLS
jgi:two-component system, chemotaxis family, chemotaxis protein CheY